MGLSIPDMTLLSQLLDEALPLDDAGRRQWLANLAPENLHLADALRRALVPQADEMRLLAAVSALPFPSGADAIQSGSGFAAGARIGPYELIRLLGTGGMAEVWLARRADGAFEREVALKLPLLLRHRQDLAPRFRRERDILARLEHPLIARLYDAGVDTGGLPYIAMEYVRGEPVNQWCEAHALGLTERLTLFLQILGAVEYAHRSQVVHHDLKPSNILVSASGEVRLVDFGIAKLMQPDDHDESPLTGLFGRALTPDYASPELLRGEPIDERSDIYALGVLLYELLTGRRPYRFSAASMGLLDQGIATLEVKAPSVEIAQATDEHSTVQPPWQRQIRGDLDAIVLKALAKDPSQRYSNVAALQADLQRFLSGRPVEALPSRLTDRLQKFLRRNGPMVVVTAVALLMVCGSLGYTLLREHRSQVTVRADVATLAAPEHSIAVLPFVDMSEQKDQGYFSDGLSEELIGLLANNPDLYVPARTSSFFFKGRAEDIATVARQLRVANVLEGSVRKSGQRLRVTAQLVRADNGYNLWSATYDRDAGDIFKIQDEISAAVVAALNAKLLHANSRPAREPVNADAYRQYLIGRELLSRGNWKVADAAAGAYRRALQIDPDYVPAWTGLANALFSSAQIKTFAQQPALQQEALDAAEKAVGLGPDQPDGYAARGLLRAWARWDFAGSEADLNHARGLAPEDPDVLTTYVDSVLYPTGRLDEAVSIMERVVNTDPLNSKSWRELGLVHFDRGEFDAARSDLQRSLRVEPDQSSAAAVIVFSFIVQGRPDLAQPWTSRPTSEIFREQTAALVQHDLGSVGEAQRHLGTLIARDANVAAYQIAQVYAWWNDKTAAMTWLERAYRQHDGGLTSVKVDMMLRNLHGDPDYEALLQRMHLAA